jgi:hypothetical protein
MESLELMWNDTPGSEILKNRQFEDVPSPDFLMLQQGPYFSGKLVGDLDSVPGYYGATTDVQFVQNAAAIKNIRIQRKKHNLETYGVLALPFEKRLEAYREAAALRPPPKVREPNVSKARGNPYKFAGQFGARFGARQIDSRAVIPGAKRLFAYNNSGVLRELPRRVRPYGPGALMEPDRVAQAARGPAEGAAPVNEVDAFADPFV